jgi:hypothetical protein
MGSGSIRNEINLNISGTEEQIARLFVTNHSGVVVKQQTVSLFNGSFIQAIDLSGISKGMYFISIQTGNEILKERFIKK